MNLGKNLVENLGKNLGKNLGNLSQQDPWYTVLVGIFVRILEAVFLYDLTIRLYKTSCKILKVQQAPADSSETKTGSKFIAF